MEKNEIRKVNKQKQKERKLIIRNNKRISKPIIKDLKKVGLKIDNVGELASIKEPYPQVIPVILKHLELSLRNGLYNDAIKRSLLRGLVCRESQGLAGTLLLEMFLKEKDNDIRWLIGYALQASATNNELNKLKRIVIDTYYGESRSELIHGVARLEGLKSVPMLVSLLNDNEQIIYATAIDALGKLKAYEVREKITPFLNHHDSWVRSETKKVLKKMDEFQQSIKI